MWQCGGEMGARRSAVLAAAVLAIAVSGCGAGNSAADWPAPNGSLDGTRAASGSAIDSSTVARLRPAWQFRFASPARPVRDLRLDAARPRGTVYVQDLESNVSALDAVSGRLLWRKRFGQKDGGPNGLAGGDGRIYGSTARSAFALDERTGKLLWLRLLAPRARRRSTPLRSPRTGSSTRAPSASRPAGRGSSTRSTPRAGRCAGGSTRCAATGPSRPKPPAAAPGGRSRSTAQDASTPGPPIPSRGEAPRPTRTAARTAARRSTRTRCWPSTADGQAAPGTTSRRRTTSATTTSPTRRYSAGRIGGRGGVVSPPARAESSTPRTARRASAVAGRRRACTGTTAGRFRRRRVDGVPGLLRRSRDADGLCRRTPLRPVVDLCMSGSATGYENLST